MVFLLRNKGYGGQAGVGVRKKADGLVGYKAGKLEGLKARKLLGFLASWLPTLKAKSNPLRAILSNS